MMDVVWAYMASRNPQELEYSIKSVQKNIKHGRLIVIGDKPEFKTIAEHHKPPICRWAFLSPHHDVIAKIYHATTMDITDDFIFMNDDFYCMKPTEIKANHRGTIQKHIDGRSRNDAYTKSLVNTKKYLVDKGIVEPLSYELHTPIVYNKVKLKKMYDDMMEIIKYNAPLLTRTLYGNIYKIGGEYMDDPKNPHEYDDKIFLSSSENSFAGRLGEYVKEKLCE